MGNKGNKEIKDVEEKKEDKKEIKDVKEQKEDKKEIKDVKEQKEDNKEIKNVEEKKADNTEIKNDKEHKEKQKEETSLKSKNNVQIKIILIILIVLVIIDIMLVYASNKENKNNQENKNEVNTISTAEQDGNKIIEYNFKDYKINLPGTYYLNVEEEFCTIEKDEIKALLTINEGTIEDLKNNSNLLIVPITDQGGKIIVEPEVKQINEKEIIYLEYTVDGKDYMVAYTSLDENNNLDIIFEKNNNEECFKLLIDVADSTVKKEE